MVKIQEVKLVQTGMVMNLQLLKYMHYIQTIELRHHKIILPDILFILNKIPMNQFIWNIIYIILVKIIHFIVQMELMILCNKNET